MRQCRLTIDHACMATLHGDTWHIVRTPMHTLHLRMLAGKREELLELHGLRGVNGLAWVPHSPL